jgi:flavin reductase (DIM6/NTAB) family NADH-FMN oxidoreductase RutF
MPRPVGWISTISKSAVRNVAPYLYFNLMGSDPPYVAIGSTGVRDSLRNLSEVPEFVANIVAMHLLERMNFTSGDFPREQDEFDWARLTAAPSAKIRPFRVAEAKAHLECEVAQIDPDRNTNIVLGRIIHAHVDPSVWKNGRVDPKLLDPVCRLSGSGYATLGDWSTSSARNGKISRAPSGSTRCRGLNGDSANFRLTEPPPVADRHARVRSPKSVKARSGGAGYRADKLFMVNYATPRRKSRNARPRQSGSTALRRARMRDAFSPSCAPSNRRMRRLSPPRSIASAACGHPMSGSNAAPTCCAR